MFKVGDKVRKLMGSDRKVPNGAIGVVINIRFQGANVVYTEGNWWSFDSNLELYIPPQLISERRKSRC